MKAAVLAEYGTPLVLADLALDDPAEHELRVRTVAAGVCHTDRTVRTGAHGTPIPNVLGHEAAGVVTAVGSGVTGFAVGDHVVTCASAHCGSCEWCLRGLSHLCSAKGRERPAGAPARLRWDGAPVTGYQGIGAFAEEMLVSERVAVRIPAEMPLDKASLLGCGVLTGVGSVLNMARVRPGQTVAVIGIGGVGLNVVQACRLSGDGRIIAIDRIPQKLDRARVFGATDVLDSTGIDAAEAVRELTGGGVDHAFEVVGRAETIESAYAMLRPRGTATVVGVPRPGTRITIDPMALFGERRLQGAAMGASAAQLDIPMLARMYLDGRLLLDELVSDRIALDDVNTALDTMEDATGARSVVVFGLRMSRYPVRDKAVVYTAAAGKVVPAGYDREAALAQWPRWSLGIRVANFLFASGAGGMEADGIVRHADDPRAQARLAMHRLVTLIRAGGAVADDLITVRVFLDDPANAAAIVAGVGEYLDEHLTTGRPAFSIVVANTSDPSVCAEIEAFAATSSERVRCDGVPQGPAAGFAHAVRVGNLYFLSAQVPLDSAGRLVSDDPAAQTRQALANLTAVLAGCGRTAADLARLTVWVASRDVLPAVEEVAGAFVREAFPAGDGPATTVVVAPLVEPGALVQVEAVAATGPRRVVDAGARRPGGLPQVGGVAVQISDEVDSFVRRFTWPEPLPGRTPDAPPSRRPLGEIVFLSAQTGTGPDGALVDGGMGPQAHRALENMRAVVEAAGGEFADIVQFDVFYADRSLYGAYNAERIAYLEQHNPESAWFAGSGPKALSPLPGALIEIESIAVLQGPPHRQEHT